MSTFKIVGAAAALSILGTMPAPAQQVISEPGYCAFFYPNANCQNKGPGNPYTDPNYYYQRDAQRGWLNGPVIGPAVTAPPRRSRVHRSHSAAIRTQ
jgi:hypothetical protein